MPIFEAITCNIIYSSSKSVQEAIRNFNDVSIGPAIHIIYPAMNPQNLQQSFLFPLPTLQEFH
jgi:hypothetical protein